MGPIQGLLRKDFRISRTLFITSLIIYLFAWVAGFGLSTYFGQPAGTLPVFILTALSLTIYAPVMMYAMLRTEGKNQLWLYSPQSSMALLLSKFTVIICYQALIQFLLSIFASISLYWFGKSVYEQIGLQLFIESIFYLNLLLLLIGIFLSCWICFYWTLYHSLANFPKLKPIRWLMIVLIFIAYNLLESLLYRIEPIKYLMTHYTVEIISSPEMSLEDAGWSVYFEQGTVPIFPFIYCALLSIVLVLIAARLLTRKVEV